MVGGKERLEDSLHLLGIESGSCILHLDQHTVRAFCRLDQQLSRRTGEGAHSVDAIHDQVNQNLLQLHPAAEQTWQIVCEVGLERDAVSAHLIAHQYDRFLNNLIDVQFRSIGSAFHEQGANSRNHRACTGCVRRSEEHTSELQSHLNLVCRLLLEKKK